MPETLTMGVEKSEREPEKQLSCPRKAAAQR